jgi:hypothetical protein
LQYFEEALALVLLPQLFFLSPLLIYLKLSFPPFIVSLDRSVSRTPRNEARRHVALMRRVLGGELRATFEPHLGV